MRQQLLPAESLPSNYSFSCLFCAHLHTCLTFMFSVPDRNN